MMNSDDIASEDTQAEGLAICKRFLAGGWLKADLNDFTMVRIRGGLSNLLYLCTLSEKLYVEREEQRRVLIRFYGKIIQENPETVLTDSIIFSSLAQSGMGPRLYGVFTGGRVEEYVPSRVLMARELHDPAISVACARKMAQFHKLTMPIVKQPHWLFDTMTRYLDDALNNLSFTDADPKKTKKLELLASYNISTELDRLRILLSKVNSPVVFCHNDLQEGNILFVENSRIGGNGKNWQVRPIDFEYASYNYRGFDIGNHFCEWCYDYKHDKYPYFLAKLGDFPNTEQQLLFIRAYLDEYHGPSNGTGGGEAPTTPTTPPTSQFDSRESEETSLLLEINAFALASHFLWALWSVVQSNISDIEFGYLDYSLVKFDAYFKKKRQLLQQYPFLANSDSAPDILLTNGH